MKSTFLVLGNSLYPIINDDASKTLDVIPVGTYSVHFNTELSKFGLSRIDDLTIPSKLYANVDGLTERILNTFFDRPAQTGVILSGEKGSGKTLLAKNISVTLREKYNIPTIIVNSKFVGDEFNKFIGSIEQEVFVFFDEFEKIYEEENDQNGLLTLFDGIYNTKKLFVVTSNNKYRINSHMLNRPGRFFYALEYKGISKEFVREYCEDKLDNKSEIETVVRFCEACDGFNFDMLQALVEEMNRYKEDVRQASKMLNIFIDTYRKVYKVVNIQFKDEEFRNAIVVEPNNVKVSNGQAINIYAIGEFWVYFDIHTPRITKSTKSNKTVSVDTVATKVKYDIYEYSFSFNRNHIVRQNQGSIDIETDEVTCTLIEYKDDFNVMDLL